VADLKVITYRRWLHNAETPNPSLSPRPATAGVVSPAPDFRSIIGHRAYATCLRGRG
jgi:hypothetical protein